MGDIESSIRTVEVIKNMIKPERESSYKKSSFYQYEEGKAGVSTSEFTSLIDNLKTLGILINYKAARAIANVALDLMSKVQPRVPYGVYTRGENDPPAGRLRRSGRIHMYARGKGFKTIGYGMEDGTVMADLTKVTHQWVKGAKDLNINIQYTRENDEGDDIAVWCHEELNPYGTTTPPRARYPNTGPKYLEIPWEENKDTYMSYLKGELSADVLTRDIAKIAVTKSRRKKFMVDSVDLVEDRIGILGYRGMSI